SIVLLRFYYAGEQPVNALRANSAGGSPRRPEGREPSSRRHSPCFGPTLFQARMMEQKRLRKGQKPMRGIEMLSTRSGSRWLCVLLLGLFLSAVILLAGCAGQATPTAEPTVAAETPVAMEESPTVEETPAGMEEPPTGEAEPTA